MRLSTSGPRAPKSPRPHHRSHQKLSPRVNLPSARLKRPRMTSLTQRSFASFCNGEPRACRALPQLPGKTQPRAIIVCGRRPPSRRAQQQTPSRDPHTRRPLRRQRRPRRRWCVHAGLISVTRRAPRLSKWRRHPPPPARHPSSWSARWIEAGSEPARTKRIYQARRVHWRSLNYLYALGYAPGETG